MTLIERLFDKVSPEPNSGCWLWVGAKAGSGYGQMHNPRGSRMAHRIAYECLVGPVGDGLELDHLCRVRLCVNPAHLEAVTHKENSKRSPIIGQARATWTHCIRGHEFTPENVYIVPSTGAKRCARCVREYWPKRKARLKTKEN